MEIIPREIGVLCGGNSAHHDYRRFAFSWIGNCVIFPAAIVIANQLDLKYVVRTNFDVFGSTAHRATFILHRVSPSPSLATNGFSKSPRLTCKSVTVFVTNAGCGEHHWVFPGFSISETLVPPIRLYPFGTMKARMGATHFLTKTLPKVAAEMALSVLAYNLTRVMNIVGTKRLMAAIAA